MQDLEIKQSSIYRRRGQGKWLLLLEALLVTFPSYLVLAIGLFVRTLRAKQ